MRKPEENDFLNMTSSTVGVDLLGALLTEIKLLPDVWQKLPEVKQNDVIDRLRKRVENAVNMAVFTIASQDRTVVAGALEQITIKDGVKAVVKFGIKAPNLDGLYEAASEGRDVLVVVAGAKDYTAGMSEVKGEPDQRGINLGREYHDNDGDGMDDTTTAFGDDEITDADPETGEIKGLPSPDQVKPTDEDLEKAFDDGYQAASEGKPRSDCPIIRSELVAQWIKGWKDWHAENMTTDEEQRIVDEGYKAAESGKTKADCEYTESHLINLWIRGFNEWHKEHPQSDGEITLN